MRTTAELVPDVLDGFRCGPQPVAPTARTRREPRTSQPPVQVPPDGGPRASLATVLRRRRSLRHYGPEPVPLPRLMDVVAHGIAADRAAWPQAHSVCPLETTAVALRVAGLEPAMHRLDPAARTSTRVAGLPALDELTVQSEFCGAAVILSLAGDLATATEVDGGHGYRTLMTRASAAAYAMWLEAIAVGWVGSVFAGFIPASVREPLCSDGSSRSQLFALALGTPPIGWETGDGAPALHHPAPPDHQREEELHA